MNFITGDHICRTPVYLGDMAGRPPTKDAPAFGAQLAALRKARKWTQPELAEKLSISLAALVHYERKATNPSSEFLSKVAALFNVSVDELLGHDIKTPRKSGPPSRLQQLTEQLSGLPRQKQKAVIEILEGYLKTAAPAH